MKQLELKHGLHHLINEITSLTDGHDPVIVAVSGGSASGKSRQVASVITDYFGDQVTHLSLDDYYHPRSYMQAHPELNFDMPGAIDLNLLGEHLDQLKRAKIVDKPIYSMRNGDRVGVEQFEPGKIILVEGIYALYPQIVSHCHYSVYVDACAHDRLWRRLARNVLVEKRNGKTMEEELSYTLSTVLPLHDKYIEPSRDRADLVILNDLNPYVESLPEAGVEDHRVRFLTDHISHDVYAKLGYHLVDDYEEVEDFFQIDDEKTIVEQPEVVKVRYIENKITLIYKIPYPDGASKVRSRIDVNLDDKMLSEFGDLYKDVIRIKKHRYIYTKDNLRVVYDEVEGQGSYSQFRVKFGGDLGKALKIASDLGIKLEYLITEPYFKLS